VRIAGGDGGIRTLDRALQPYNGLANRRLQPLGHISAARRDSRPPDMPDARAHCKTRAQPRGYRALWAEQNFARVFVRGQVGLSPIRERRRPVGFPALDPTDARTVARQTLVDDAEQAIDLVRIAIDRVGGSSRARRGENDGACPAIGPSPLICQNNHS
jgi:hypothetical protein